MFVAVYLEEKQKKVFSHINKLEFHFLLNIAYQKSNKKITVSMNLIIPVCYFLFIQKTITKLTL